MLLLSSAPTFQIPPDDLFHNYNVSTNTFYLTFWRDGIPGPFLLLVTLRWAIALLGFLLNLALFAAIQQNWNMLNGTCSLFIALNAIFTALFELSLTVPLGMQLLGIQVVPLKTCFLIQILPIFCRNMIISTLFAVGIDRLISVIFVIWHINHGQNRNYRLALLSICIFHSLFFLVFCSFMAFQMPQLRIICLSSDDCYQGDGEQILFLVNTALLGLILLCYLLIWIFLRLHANNAEVESTKRIIKSLTLTATLISLGWLSYNALQSILLPNLSLQPVPIAYLTFSSSILPYIAMALNAPMYFWFSKDYHAAFVKVFRWLPKKMPSNSNQIGPAIINVQSNSKLQSSSPQRARRSTVFKSAVENGNSGKNTPRI